MTTHKILTIILIILAVFLGVSVLFQNQKADEVIVTPPNNDQVVSTTTIATTTPVQPTAPKPTQTFPKEVSLTTKNNYQFPDGSILSIKEINDSRCAPNVNCIWAGNIVSKMNIKKGNTLTEDFDLTFGPGEESTMYTYGVYKLKIIKVTPDKGPTSEILKQNDYTLTLQVSK